MSQRWRGTEHALSCVGPDANQATRARPQAGALLVERGTHMSATLICTEADAMRGAAIGAAEKPQTGAYRESMAKDCAGAIGTIERERRRAAVGRAGEKNGPCDGELAGQDPRSIYLPVSLGPSSHAHVQLKFNSVVYVVT